MARGGIASNGGRAVPVVETGKAVSGAPEAMPATTVARQGIVEETAVTNVGAATGPRPGTGARTKESPKEKDKASLCTLPWRSYLESRMPPAVPTCLAVYRD